MCGNHSIILELFSCTTRISDDFEPGWSLGGFLKAETRTCYCRARRGVLLSRIHRDRTYAFHIDTGLVDGDLAFAEDRCVYMVRVVKRRGRVHHRSTRKRFAEVAGRKGPCARSVHRRSANCVSYGGFSRCALLALESRVRAHGSGVIFGGTPVDAIPGVADGRVGAEEGMIPAIF
jgi:hypothetical protein